MSVSLLLLAATALDLGTSPLVEPGHTHDWVVIQEDKEGTGWIDAAWRSETVVDGQSLKLVLMRTDIQPPEAMVSDIVMAVDCQGDRLGMKQIWVYEAAFGQNVEVPIASLKMDFAETPPSDEDLKIIKFACGTGPATR